MITRLEELSLNAWPALQTLLLDGWVLRLADGYTRRANSVNPLYPAAQPLEEKIAACERLYATRGQDVVFKLTPAAQPAGLDECLAERGYQHEADTSVQILDITTASFNPTGEVRLTERVSEAWLADFCRMSDLPERRQPTLRRMLESLAPEHCFISLGEDGESVACGLAVAQDGYAGLFDIITGAAHRNQGHGRRIVHNLLAWARDHNAHTAYLQVMLNNAAAMHLYGAVGFGEVYRYWYRVRR